MRQVLLTCAALVLAPSSWGVAQVVPSPQPASAYPVAGKAGVSAAASAPLLRKLISLDLRDAPLSDALDAVSAQLDERLMYAGEVDASRRRVTLVAESIQAGEALRRILDGTGLQTVIPEGGSVVLLKRLSRAPAEPQRRQAPDTAAIAGRVVDAASGEPIAQVMVTVDDGRYSAMTNASGGFRLPRLPSGERSLAFESIGYRTLTMKLTLRPGQDTTLVVRMTSEPIALNELVTTVTGQEMRYRVGNSIARIDVDADVATNAYQNLSDLLASTSNGLIAQPSGGSPNAPTRLRIRGINSINASNDPIIIIDGVRAVTGFARCVDGNLPGCNNVPSRYDDFDINTIESIEVLKGPSAAAMWGSEAASGVIVIKTKRGSPGATRYTLQYDEGFQEAPKNLRVPMQGLGSPVNGTAVTVCTILDQAAGRCVPIDSIAGGFDRMAHERTRSVATGRTREMDLTASGGSETVQFFLSAGYRTQLGTSKMPDVDQKLVRESLGQDLPYWMIRPDARDQYSFTGRLTGDLSETLRYALTTSYVELATRTGPDGVHGSTSDLRSAADTLELSRGWEDFYVEREHDASRFTGSLALNWDPTLWFSGRAVFGRDYAFTDDGAYRRRNWCRPYCTSSSRDASGKVDYGEGRDMAQTVDLGAQLRFPLMDGRVTLQTAAGAQHTRIKTQSLRGSTYDLPVGRIDFNASPSANRSVFQSFDDRATLGMYLHQTVGLNDRLFLSAALRRDIGSALGEAVAPIYPKFSLSWLASEEPMFGLAERGIQLRLRAAYGHAGVQPSTMAKYRTFGQSPRFIEPDGTYGTNYAFLGGVGNSELRPERSREMEGGFEVGLFDDRLIFDYTYFHKFTRDAIVSRELAPSLGLGSLSRQSYNVGDVRNTGMEAYLTARILERENLMFDLRVGYASRENELVELGAGVEPYSITASNIELANIMDNDGVVMPGYPLFGRWARPLLGYSDTNGDGLITSDEVRLGDELVFMGPSQPKADMSIQPHIDTWGGRIGLEATFTYVHGLTQLNSYASTMRYFTPAAFDPNAPLRVQACYAAASPPYNNDYCFYETTNVLRLNTASLRIDLPQRLLGWIGASGGSIYVLGSNLGVWTGFDGIDPMVNTADPAGNRNLSGAVMPRGRTITFRTRLMF